MLHRQWPVAGECHDLELNEHGQSTNETRPCRSCGWRHNWLSCCVRREPPGGGMRLDLFPLGAVLASSKYGRVAAGSPPGGCCCEFGGRDCSKTRAAGRGDPVRSGGTGTQSGWERRGVLADPRRAS